MYRSLLTSPSGQSPCLGPSARALERFRQRWGVDHRDTQKSERFRPISSSATYTKDPCSSGPFRAKLQVNIQPVINTTV